MANGNSFSNGGSCGWKPPVPGKRTEAWLWRVLSALPPGLAGAFVVLMAADPHTFYRA